MKRLFWTVLAASFLVLAAATALAGERRPEAELPLRRVALYSSGIGYFERSGTITGDRPLTLSFKTSSMGDVLKSLTAIDLTHGSVSLISYPGPGSAFDDFDISAGMIEFLEEFKGAPVQYRVNNTTLDGFIMGVEESDERRGDETIFTRDYLLVMRPNGEIRRTAVDDISWIGFTDARLNDEIKKNLQATFARSSYTSKNVHVFSKESGPRQMLIAYALPTPEWKATYRLVLSDDNTALLQGWVAVENDTEEDWRDVQIALIAGNPLYHPSDLYGRRYTGDWGPLEGWGADDQAMNWGGQLLQVTTTEAAELFRYDMEYPVTIERNHSALLPIVNRQVEAQPVSVYNQQINTEFPQAAVRMTNTTGLTLERGPVVVYHNDTFAGDCHTAMLRPDQQCYLMHGVDLGTRISTAIDISDQNVHRVRFHRGSMITYHRQRSRMVYTFSNRDARDKIILIEHPVREQWELAGSVRPIERTGEHYRFEALLPSRGNIEVPVVEEKRISTTYKVDSITPEEIALFVRQNYIDDELQNALKEIVSLRESADELAQELKRMEESRSTIFANQQRLRENLQALGDTPAEASLRQRYIAIMSDEEDTLRNINTQMRDVRTQFQTMQRLLQTAIRELDREYEPK